MNQRTLKSLLTLWDSQGLLQGDLNPIQQYCKSYILGTEGEQKLDLLKIETLASNPDVYKALFEGNNERLGEDEWRTLAEVPEEEMAAVFAEIEAYQAQRDEL